MKLISRARSFSGEKNSSAMLTKYRRYLANRSEFGRPCITRGGNGPAEWKRWRAPSDSAEFGGAGTFGRDVFRDRRPFPRKRAPKYPTCMRAIVVVAPLRGPRLHFHSTFGARCWRVGARSPHKIPVLSISRSLPVA